MDALLEFVPAFVERTVVFVQEGLKVVQELVAV
jgi:hypothetical protein